MERRQQEALHGVSPLQDDALVLRPSLALEQREALAEDIEQAYTDTPAGDEPVIVSDPD